MFALALDKRVILFPAAMLIAGLGRMPHGLAQEEKQAEKPVNTRITRPAVIALELFGRGVFFTFNIDHVYSEFLAMGVGFGQAPVKTPAGEITDLSAYLFPLYVHYYFLPEKGAPYLSISATFLGNPGQVAGLVSTVGGITFASAVLLPTFGMGYEQRMEQGFVFRLTGYAIASGTVKPWVGLTLGYSF